MKQPPIVLCVESALVERQVRERGFIPQQELSWLAKTPAWFVPRPHAEERQEFRQLIPYILLVSGPQVVVYRRGSAGGEARLHQQLSLGFGGHVDLADAVFDGEELDVLATLERTATREITEELGELPIIERQWVGAILSDTDAVSRVHLGLVQIARLPSVGVAGQETAIRDCRFEPIKDLSGLNDRLEGWSQLCAAWLIGQLSP